MSSVHTLPNAEGVALGYIHAFKLSPFEVPTIVYCCGEAEYRNDVPLIILTNPGTYQFLLTNNKTPQGDWKFLTPEAYLQPSGNGIDVADMVNHPPHYTSSKAHCGNCKESIECIEIARHMSFNIGNAVKYLWRHELKGGIEDLKKAKWYINDAIKQLENEGCEK
jgi:hypothetical protein